MSSKNDPAIGRAMGLALVLMGVGPFVALFVREQSAVLGTITFWALVALWVSCFVYAYKRDQKLNNQNESSRND